MERTLLLNASYEPLKVVPWQRAVHLFFQGKVEVVESYGRDIRSARLSMKVPAVVRLYRMVLFHHTRRLVKFSRETIFARDRYSCQYCGQTFAPEFLTFDHVIPVAQGGTKTWENIVTACRPCNHRKSGMTPEQAGMILRGRVSRPHWSPAIMVMMTVSGEPPKLLEDYLFFR